ncbi:hypothetical protein PHYSODRAFT_248239 [Phytophthora sojae]|uniref:NAD(P)-binding domain-containing protein n=1 Tax=Phytophthora sojae (strain P6497) TaxID=1094619 RepID=G4YG90_PHYSP|nr:hypothetical protein PHYSODRAFT_248239 [Phytophthora sojae]EGZ28702.1 hypothetical protein PHYSODRAFT_248239 [Phytophthora sojae]|eukprot:XP_009515977.1 hypothetical protein PHYSODRAFT_248239 [Phytophthora sojae]
MKERNPNAEVTHVKLDVSSLHDVRKFTDAHKEAAFDWIIMSPGILSLKGRTGTPEGLDVKMATHYYGRFMIIYDLLSTLDRPGVRVLNILAPTTGGQPDVSDLDLKKTFSIKRCADFTTTYSDLMAQAFSEKAPQASFMHASPGAVATSIADNLPWYARLPAKALGEVIARSPEECAKFMVMALTKDEFSSGWHLVNRNAGPLEPTKFQTEEMKEIVWKHSVDTIKTVLEQEA